MLGSPRSGTTWLAKIFDSHPEILYRHEPDELALANPELDPASQVREWLRQRGLRVAAKRPNFQKSWRPATFDTSRRTLAAMLAVAQRLPLTSSIAERIGLPDLVAPDQWRSIRAAIKLVNWDGTRVARTMPDTRCVFIMRHPCGQIASLMAGLAARHFARAADESGAPVQMAMAAACAARRNVDAATFATLPDAAKYAWAWLAFNEPAVERLRDLPNARIVIYEDLCQQPEATARDLFRFAGLNWHPQVAAFLSDSTQHDQPAGYFDVFRTTGLVTDRWRQNMSQQDQDAVRAVVATSSLARCWADLA
ncbi:MAG: sulfotransferase [Rhodopila sp.]|nr:sulfotransferase [Rhodopila sp.]